MCGTATFPLTRELYRYVVDLEMRRAIRNVRFVGLCQLSLDGDSDPDAEMVRTVSAILRGTLRETDIVGLLNDRTFSVLLDSSEIHEAYLVGERIRNRIADHRFTSEDRAIRRTVSVGCVSFPTHGCDTATILLAADEMLETAKRLGGNAVAIPP